MDCSCGGVRDRVQIYKVVTIGPVWDKLEEYNSNLLSSKERAAGKELKSKKDIDQWERDRGLVRMAPSSSEARMYAEKTEHEAKTIEKIHKSDGKTAVVDYFDKTSVLEGTSWDSAQYNRWKEANDAAESRIESGDANI